MYGNYTPVGVPCRLRLLTVLLVCAFVCQLAGFVAPAWIVVSFGSSRGYFGLWFFVMCEDDSCVTYSMTEMSTLDSNTLVVSVWTQFQAETSVGIVCCIVALICRSSRQTHVLGVAAFFSFVSGILALVSSGLFLAGILYIGYSIEETKPYNAPYALIATMLGGILVAIAGIVAVYSACKGSGDPHLNQPQTINMPQYATTMTAAIATAPPAYLVTNGAYVIEQTNPYIGRQANNADHVTY